MMFLWLMFESLMFFCFNAILLLDDDDVYVWIIQIGFHLVFICIAYSITRFSSRFLLNTQLRQKYYFFWAFILLINDLLLMVYNVWFSHDHSRDTGFYVCLIAATLTFFMGFFANPLLKIVLRHHAQQPKIVEILPH
jgi:hypothetical protein